MRVCVCVCSYVIYIHIYIFFTDSCPMYAFYCATDRRCIYGYLRCNYAKDCTNGEDEIDCRKILYVTYIIIL